MKFRGTTLREISGGGTYGLGAAANHNLPSPKFLRTTDIVSGSISWDTVPSCEASDGDIIKYLLQDGDIVISRTGANAGINCLISNPPKDAIFAGYLVRFRIPANEADSRFVSYVLQSQSWQDYVDATRTGSAQPQLNAVLMGNFELSLPELKIQTEIADILESLDEKIRVNQQIASTLEQIAQTIFKSWFIDFDPVHAKARGEQPVGMDAETAALFPDSFEDSELGSIPSGWKSGPISELLTLQGGFSFKSSAWTESGTPVVKIGSVKPGLVDLSQVSYVPNDVAATIDRRYQLTEGSLVIGLTGYVGEVGLVPHSLQVPLLNQRVAKFGLVGRDWMIPFAYCLSREPKFKSEVDSAATGSAQANVSNSQILDIHRVIPPHEVNLAFDTLMNSSFDQILRLVRQNQTLEAIRDSLLPRLISGELEIPAELLEA